ncbi:hypothetical protein [Candidatus Poriferisocius sp.]|uniref:hypothetical protein n=1 Tax=Candidatus Poriferisocius sp. TaxID=3101276 RepID=UPI003B011222
MPTAAISILLVMIASMAVVKASATRWMRDVQDRRAAEEQSLKDYAWPEVDHRLRSLRDPE